MNPSGAARQALERRSERRVAVRLSMRVRGTDREGVCFEDTTESKNVSRAGAAFAIARSIDPGADLEIAIPRLRQGGEAETEFATRGRVVHVAPGRDRHERIVGVAFTGPRFHRLFVSEDTA